MDKIETHARKLISEGKKPQEVKNTIYSKYGEIITDYKIKKIREEISEGLDTPKPPKIKPKNTIEEISEDIDKKNAKKSIDDVQRKNKIYIDRIEELEETLNNVYQIKKKNTFEEIGTQKHIVKTESTPIVCASDWHVEEVVKGYTISNLNEYNPEVARKRATAFAQNGLKIIQGLGRETTIKEVVMWLGGDFISGHIHDELKEENAMSPLEAIQFSKGLLKATINHYLDNSGYNINIITNFGNHGRNTKKMTHGEHAYKHSFEYYMYLDLAEHYQDNKRVKFKIEKGYFNYLPVYDKILRFHHGHNVKFNGGIGGLYIPTNKAIAQWNKGKRADIDVFGHYHQMIDGGNFICNGSMIGFGPYAESIKASPERPAQALFLLNNKYGKTINAPIILE